MLGDEGDANLLLAPSGQIVESPLTRQLHPGSLLPPRFITYCRANAANRNRHSVIICAHVISALIEGAFLPNGWINDLINNGNYSAWLMPGFTTIL